ncbi:MAG: dTMP kinase [Chloroflexi bacterium]|nr:dTMP kinase [Chloroflexota bacterium]
MTAGGASVFIVLEGIDGAGKTTQLALLTERLRQRSPEVVATQEPGGTPLGDRLREVVKHGADLDIVPRAELLLFAASRAQLVERVLRPALARGVSVVCDRYVFSTVAYQGYGRGVDRGLIAAAVDLATGGLLPDLVVLLDLEVRLALQRIASPGRREPTTFAPARGRDRFEGEALAFYERVRQGYRDQAAVDPDRWLVLDATRPPDHLARIIWEKVEKFGLQG